MDLLLTDADEINEEGLVDDHDEESLDDGISEELLDEGIGLVDTEHLSRNVGGFHRSGSATPG